MPPKLQRQRAAINTRKDSSLSFRCNENSGVSAQRIDMDECIASVDSSLCFGPGHAEVNDLFCDIGLRVALTSVDVSANCTEYIHA